MPSKRIPLNKKELPPIKNFSLKKKNLRDLRTGNRKKRESKNENMQESR